MVPYYRDQQLDSIFSTRDPEHHKSLKRPVAQLFSMSNMRNYEPYANECSAIFTQTMRELEGQNIDLSDWLQWYAFDVIACITFQRRFGFMEQRRDVDDMMRDTRAALAYFKVVGQYPALHSWGMGNRRFVTLLKTFMPNMPDALSRFLQVTEQEIERYDREEKKEGVERTDFLAQIRSKQQISDKITYMDLVNHLSNNILAGSDTTAIALRSCFYYLIKTPAAYYKLQVELDEAEARGELSPYITYEECLRLPYLQAVMKEALRIHPGICFPLERYVPEGGATVCGVHLPAGTNISMSAPTIHFDKDIYGADADRFRPERWIESPPDQIREMDRCFLAFGQGARTCIGKNISILEMGKFLPQILRQFDIEWASDEPEWKTDAAWLWLQWGLIVRFKVRGKTM
ncbi:uncharacterized protein A1O9_00526 [Exophiala aquamarina CBS 119918]|uniref:Cytochrome P450 oxidoreductase n=1 Tax=Exophiala aquamarina CBS 119918 TaxID=1182545 RepID=A0A072PT76_9EURO|nr:uncharacterized protein A1O9_00526 [Exophiala aquamarina CBS 119918]KEF62553.1 hypothetical protein A1O9_00526 [Exophiala aquamarina CBS 119918]